MADAFASSVLFLGMAGAFSLPPLEVLLQAGVQVCGVVLPLPPREGAGVRKLEAPARPSALALPILMPHVRRNIGHVAWERGIPVYEVADLSALDMAPDIIAVACFDRLIPRAMRARAKLAVNVHPSLLPANRGPAPLFWTFRLGERTTGVTIHLLEDKADAGAILAQREVPVAEGIDGAELDQELARIGGELLVQVVADFEKARLRPTIQDESRATSHPWPSAKDWAVPADWPAERAAAFMRGTAHMRPGR
ncbi:MAG TPA: formyltransferase family protein [Chloroflexota bacterium]|nr:formyltransferase family protein [Chloroflexota bacterium]